MEPGQERVAAGMTGGRMNRRRLVKRLTAAGFATPVIAAIVAAEAGAQDATPVATPKPSTLPQAPPLAPLAPKVGLINPADYGKDPRLIKYSPADYGMPIELIDTLTVPNSLFFIRSHGPTAFIDAGAWKLKVTGLVNSEQELTLDDLKGMPTRQLTAFFECSGDSRGRFQPKANGTQ